MHFGGRFYRILMVRKRRIYIEIATLVKLLKLVFLFLLNKIGMFLANKLLNIYPTKFLFVTLTLEESPPPQLPRIYPLPLFLTVNIVRRE